ncbi:hypothetical protein OAG72_01195, partial [bacterium]|nr:hypothetical protein [bacterium]
MGLADKTIEGLGDITLSALWYPWIGEAGELRSLGFSAGLILPTGDSGGSQAGISIPSVFQLGTGAYQATLGIRYAKSIDDWTFATSADVLFPLNESSEGFRPAKTIFGSASVAHALTDSLSGRLALNYSSGGRDEFQGVAYSNTGSTTLSLAPSASRRQTAAFGFGDGIYNMGDPVEEDVNGMLYRAVRWFIDQASPDGFRLDAVKHVPDSFFGKQNGADKDYVNWGYNGAIQEQFNLTRGYSDWNNHRDTVFNTEYQSRDDALLYGEHLGEPPGFEGYLNSGMRIATDTMLNAVKSSIGSNMSGMDAGGWGHYGGNAAQSMSYVMSHDNTHLFGGDRQQAHAWMLMKEGIPIVYTDGYHVAGEPDYFPKPSYIPFLGQNNDGYMPAVLNIHRDFARGYQVGKWNDPDFLSWERHDEREKKGGSWNSPTLLVMMARNYQGGFHSRAAITTSFPTGARLRNYS